MYNTDIVNSIVKLIVHSPVDNLVYLKQKNKTKNCVWVCGFFVFLFCWSNITSV